jgi:hypothetical protein
MTPRRWFRFSLRTMLVVIVLLACGLAWVESQRRKIDERQRLINEIVLEMRHHRSNGGDSIKEEFSGLKVWRRWLGDRPWASLPVPWPEGSDRWNEVRQKFPESILYYAPPLSNEPARDVPVN